MPKLIMGIGIPGAGKSTVLRSFAEKYGYEFISMDDVREKYDLPEGQPATEREWYEIGSRMIESIKGGKSVVVDATFADDIRQRFIGFARENGVQKIQGIFLDPPTEIAWARNLARDRKVSREVFDKRAQSLKDAPPEMTDGFDALFTLDENGELKEAQIPKDGEREITRERKFI